MKMSSSSSKVQVNGIEKFLSLLKTTNGRDKFYRFIVYFSKYLAAVYEHDKEALSKIEKGSKSVGLSRKLFRFGRSLEYLQELTKAPSISNPFLRVAAILKSISFTFWMLADHVQWLDKVGYIKVSDEKRLEKIHARGWMYGLLISIITDIYKINALNKDIQNAQAKDKPALLQKRQDQFVGLAKNGLDVLIPATRLDIIDIQSKYVGLIGAITSIIGFYQAWNGKA